VDDAGRNGAANMRTVSTSRSQLPVIVGPVGSRRPDTSKESDEMNRRVWTGVIAGVLAAVVLLTVGIGSYRAGQDDEVVTRTVGDGEVVRVVDHGRHFFPGFFLFPLLLILLAVVLVRGGRRHWHGYGHGYGNGGPGWGPGPGYGPGPGWRGGPGWGPEGVEGPGGPEASWQDWHRRQHESPDEPEPDDRSPGAPGPGPGPDPKPPSTTEPVA
jgi:hypothetical protein